MTSWGTSPWIRSLGSELSELSHATRLFRGLPAGILDAAKHIHPCQVGSGVLPKISKYYIYGNLLKYYLATSMHLRSSCCNTWH